MKRKSITKQDMKNYTYDIMPCVIENYWESWDEEDDITEWQVAAWKLFKTGNFWTSLRKFIRKSPERIYAVFAEGWDEKRLDHKLFAEYCYFCQTI